MAAEHRSQIIESIQCDLVLKGAIYEKQQRGTLSSLVKLFYEDPHHVCNFLIKLHFLVKSQDTLKIVYKFIPSIWIIDLSKIKASLFLEVLQLQAEKKLVELIDWSDEESEMRSFLQCLSFISKLR